MTKEELEKEAEKKYCNGCKWRIEQCLWAWRKTNGLKEPNEKNCSCKEVPAYLAGADPREKRIAELEAQIEKMKSQYDYAFTQLLESREIVCLMLSQYRNKKEINYSTRERGEKLLKQGVYKHD